MREYIVEDINGYHLRFGEGAGKCDPEKDRPIPAGVKIVSRKPTNAEYAALIQSVGWNPYTNAEVREQAIAGTRHCVVAELKGKAIGYGAVLGDGASFFYIKDVMVLPEHQKQGIGTAIWTR